MRKKKKKNPRLRVTTETLAPLTWRSPNPTCLPPFVPCLRVVGPPCPPFLPTPVLKTKFLVSVPSVASFQTPPPYSLSLTTIMGPTKLTCLRRGSILLAPSSYINHSLLSIVTPHYNSSSLFFFKNSYFTH